ncbi:MAG: helix-turn-helix transcriptional regulator [Acidobacteria bacterium]|nr:helix-turn-helix transcriptional regulator [Acidobacteriota bacterium]
MSSTLGVLIREARERAGLTQADVARRAGTSQPAIARYEAEQARPRLETVQRCVEACGFELRIELERTSPQRQAAAEAARACSVEDRLRTNDAFTRFAAELRRG